MRERSNSKQGKDVRRERRVASVVAAVIRHAADDAGAAGVVVLDDGSPEAGLAVRWSVDALGSERVHAVRPSAGGDAEAHRHAARVLAGERGALLCHPANKTALLLAPVPPEPLLPLGDLYASQVAELTGAWSAPDSVRRLAEEVGGVTVLDEILSMLLDERREPAAVLSRHPAAGPRVMEAMTRARFWRNRCGLVPKLGARTLGIDLFE